MSDVMTTSGSQAARAPRNRRIRLSRGRYKATLVTHIIASGAWIGIDVIVAVLVITGRFGGDPALRSLAYRALAAFVVWPMLAAGLVSLQPGMAEVADYGRDLLAGRPDPAAVSSLFFPPAVSLTALTLATALAVVKPWGRIRRRAREGRT
jgi:hypothetical protein